MPFDALTLKAVTAELSDALADCRIDKIHQSTRDSLVLQLRSRAGTRRLYLCANPGYPRIHLTQMATENPAKPPMFCMLLRKHLQGGRFVRIEQAGLERCVALTFSCTDEMGEVAEKRLVAELMGRTSNLILVGPDGRVIDCLRRVDLTMSERRPVLPGLRYELPPKQEKSDPALAGPEALADLLAARTGDPLDRVLLDAFFGLSPLLCRELAYRATGNVDTPVPADVHDLAGFRPGEDFHHFCFPVDDVPGLQEMSILFLRRRMIRQSARFHCQSFPGKTGETSAERSVFA